MQAHATVTRYTPRPDEAAAGMKPGWQVETRWTAYSLLNLDRPQGVGFVLGQKRDLAERLARAINAGVVFTRPEIKRDVNQKSYVSSEIKVRGRCLNADLKRLGF